MEYCFLHLHRKSVYVLETKVNLFLKHILRNKIRQTFFSSTMLITNVKMSINISIFILTIMIVITNDSETQRIPFITQTRVIFLLPIYSCAFHCILILWKFLTLSLCDVLSLGQNIGLL